jgi:carnitine O-acetyltransferase
MDQFKALFATTRIPMKNAKDAIYVFDKSNHIAVLCRGSVYYFQVLWPNGNVAVDEADIADILEAIQRHALEEVGTSKDPLKGQQSIGVLTSLPRNEWAQAREDLTKHSPKNAESLKIIDSALFVLVLDDYTPKNKHDAAANMLHGSYLLKGSSRDQDEKPWSPSAGHQSASPRPAGWLKFADYQAGSCCNRWYDKLQIIVCADGTAGINFEHSAIDGHTALRFVSDVYAETVIKFAQSITKLVAAHDMIPNVISAQVIRAATVLDGAGRATLDVFPKKIHFDIPDSIHRKIYYAETALGDEIVASETFVLEFKDYGKAFITNNQLSPDSYVQMSMMLAYYKLYGRIVCAYEPVLTKNFFHGRTEAMRPATLEAKSLCEVFTDTAASVQDKISALRKATQVHSQLVKECSQGLGVDRHLFALKCIAEKKGLPIPPFYHSKPWKLLNHTILSTSNCGNPSIAGFGFGPVVPDGLGIGYIIKENQLHYSISSKHRQTRRYAYTLESVLNEMSQLFLDQKKDTVGAALRAADAAARRQHLSNTPLPMIMYDSYGDMWGESSGPLTQQGSQKKDELVTEGSLPVLSAPDSLKRLDSKDSISLKSPRLSYADDLDWDLAECCQLEAPRQIGEIEDKAATPRHVLRRQSSKEVGPVLRVRSIHYAALSQQGIHVEMPPKP